MLQIWQTMESKNDYWVPTNEFSISYIPNVISCLWINLSINSFLFMLNQPMSKQSNLKYLGILLCDQASWKYQIERLVKKFLNNMEFC